MVDRHARGLPHRLKGALFMVSVSVEGVRRNFGISSVYMYTVALVDETEGRIFNVGVERHEALPIVAALHGLDLPRPQTINFMTETLSLHSMALKEMQLEYICRTPIYPFAAFTTLRWLNSSGDEVIQKLELRPGDAIGLALLMHAPLFLSDELARGGVILQEGETPELYLLHDLFKREGISVPADKKLRLGFSKTPMRDALVKEFKASLLGKAPPFPEADLEQRKAELLAFVLGDD